MRKELTKIHTEYLELIKVLPLEMRREISLNTSGSLANHLMYIKAFTDNQHVVARCEDMLMRLNWITE